MLIPTGDPPHSTNNVKVIRKINYDVLRKFVESNIAGVNGIDGPSNKYTALTDLLIKVKEVATSEKVLRQKKSSSVSGFSDHRIC